jgi:hypothetical protein
MFRSERIHAQSVGAVSDLGLDPHVSAQKAIFTFLEKSEAVASRWIQFPAGVLLFLTVPGNPRSGAIYVLDRRRALFYLLEFEGEADGQLTAEDYERLVRQHRLFDLIRRPWRLRSLVESRKQPDLGSFASASAIG